MTKKPTNENVFMEQKPVMVTFMENRVKEHRTARGMTQTYLAEKMGVSGNQVSQIESGVRRLTDAWAVQFARALGCQPGDLMPIIDDGTVPLPETISSYELKVLRKSLSDFLEIHTEMDPAVLDNMSKAAIKMFLINLDRLNSAPDYLDDVDLPKTLHESLPTEYK